MALQACTSGVSVPSNELSEAGGDGYGKAAAQGWVRSVVQLNGPSSNWSLAGASTTRAVDLERRRLKKEEPVVVCISSTDNERKRGIMEPRSDTGSDSYQSREDNNEWLLDIQPVMTIMLLMK